MPVFMPVFVYTSKPYYNVCLKFL